MENGEKFGRWTVVTAYANTARALVRCDCGTEREVQRGDLANGASRSCGCLRAEITSARFRRHGSGYEDYRYRLWRALMGKCYRPAHGDYRYYGGRGIAVWDPWH